MAQPKISWERLLQIQHRQKVDRWSPHYVAAIFADPTEAPSISTATILAPAKLGHRALHTLSFSETCAALLALYNSACFEVFDQRAMSTLPRPHILQGHPRASGLRLQPFRGTIDVAERLGMTSTHRKVRARVGSNPADWPWTPFPYIADLTLCLTDEQGPYLVDWPIKDKYENFRRSGPRNSRRRPDVDDPAVVLRNELQRIYYLDAGIRTQEVVGMSIDFQVRCNLRELFLDESYPVPLSDSIKKQVTVELAETVGKDVPACLTAYKLSAAYRVAPRDITALLRQAIWNREIRVDFFEPIAMEKPLRPEREDVLQRYAGWFAR